MTVQEWLKQLRVDLGEDGRAMTQKAMAEMLGVSDAAWCRWENGQRKPPAMAVRLLEQLTGRVYDRAP